eukprot:241171-Prymnesium_polylepis.1
MCARSHDSASAPAAVHPVAVAASVVQHPVHPSKAMPTSTPLAAVGGIAPQTYVPPRRILRHRATRSCSSASLTRKWGSSGCGSHPRRAIPELGATVS